MNIKPQGSWSALLLTGIAAIRPELIPMSAGIHAWTAGAVGVMQITPETWAFVVTFVIGHPVATTVDGNVQVGVAYVRYLLRIFGGDTTRAVAAYLQGPSSVSAQGILPPTVVYVNDVLALARRL